MAKPNVLCKLFKGKLVDTFTGFVDTFNFLVDFVENLKGDGDNDASKDILVDRSVPDRPVIKMRQRSGSENLEVITDFQCVIEEGFLQLKITKAKLKNVSFEEVEYDGELHRRPIAGAVVDKKIITNTHYNQDGDYTFKQDEIDGALILYPKDAQTIPAEDTESVFITTLHT